MSTAPPLASFPAFSIGGNEPLFLSGEASREDAWIIERGTLDVFLVQFEHGEPVTPRVHIFRAEAGMAVFSVPGPVDGFTLLASASPDTVVLSVTLKSLREADSESAARYLQLWIEALSAALEAPLPPQDWVPMEPGQRIHLTQQKTASSKAAMVWAKHLSGSSRLFGDVRLPQIGQDALFPVTPKTWLQAESNCALWCLPDGGLGAEDPDWRNIAFFHRIAMAVLARNCVRKLEGEVSRLAARGEYESNLRASTAAQLASPLRDRSEVGVSEASGDPLLQACRAIGGILAVDFKAPLGDAKGTDRFRIMRIAKASRVRYRPVLLRDNWWREDNGPLLAFREGKPLALLPTARRKYAVFDPLSGSVTPLAMKIAPGFEDVAYQFHRSLPEKSVSTLGLLRFGLLGCKGDLRFIFGIGLLTGALGMATPIFSGMIFEDVIPNSQFPQLVQFGIVLLVIAVSSLLFDMARNFAMMRVEGKASSALQGAVIDRLLNMPAKFFRGYSSGDLAARAMGIDTIRQVMSGTVLTSIFSALFSVFNLGLLFYYSPKLALVASAIVFIALVTTTGTGYLELRLQREQIDAGGKLSSLVLQLIQGIGKLRVAGAEERAYARWAEEFTKQQSQAVRAALISNRLRVFNTVFSICASVWIFYVIAGDAAAGMLSTGQFIAFNAAFGQYFGAVLSLGNTALSALSVVPLWERAKPLLTSLPEVTGDQTDPGELTGSIELSHVDFRYNEDGPLIIKDLSLRIEAGEFVALVGASGCGKSTIVRLLLGFETPISGSVYYDGQDLSGLDIQAVRRQMGVVIQNGTLLPGDIFANIIGSAPLRLDDAWEAARLAGLDKDIEAMPMGMHTILGEGGSGLSGGQRQRLMIARAIVHRPRILLFDEATSALDNQTQSIVSKSLARLKSTRVVVAHRLSTIMEANRIFVLDEGRLVQSGTYSELMEQPGVFAELAKRQLT